MKEGGMAMAEREEEKAFEELYNANARKVYAYLRSRGVDEQTAADILQETFVAAWRGSAGFKGSAKPLTWLIAISRHKLADEMRTCMRSRASPLEGNEEAAGPDPIAQAHVRISVRQAVQTLEDAQKELLHLVFVLGMGYAETAQVLEVPEGTVKSRMFALKRQLAGRLQEGTP
jgi:RNA polymerase sigma-70 factor (ECF subfamily)